VATSPFYLHVWHLYGIMSEHEILKPRYMKNQTLNFELIDSLFEEWMARFTCSYGVHCLPTTIKWKAYWLSSDLQNAIMCIQTLHVTVLTLLQSGERIRYMYGDSLWVKWAEFLTPVGARFSWSIHTVRESYPDFGIIGTIWLSRRQKSEAWLWSSPTSNVDFECV
jgi:hypothetical protein